MPPLHHYIVLHLVGESNDIYSMDLIFCKTPNKIISLREGEGRAWPQEATAAGLRWPGEETASVWVTGLWAAQAGGGNHVSGEGVQHSSLEDFCSNTFTNAGCLIT